MLQLLVNHFAERSSCGTWESDWKSSSCAMMNRETVVKDEALIH